MQARLPKRGGGWGGESAVGRYEPAGGVVRGTSLTPEPVFDLLLARQIWRATRSLLLEKAEKKGAEKLVRDILPHTLLARWPDPPAPSQEEIAKRHGISGTRLKAYFNRTLKVQARREFDSEALTICPGITDEDTQHLWNLLCRYGDI